METPSINREKKLMHYLDGIESKVEEIRQKFGAFSDGPRMILMMKRKKDGGPNKEDKRIFESYITFNSEEFYNKVRNLLVLKLLYPEHTLRIYSSANVRSIEKVVRQIKQGLLDAEYSDEEQRSDIYKKVVKNPRKFFMAVESREEKLFIIDSDNVDGVDVQGDDIKEMSRLGVVELLRYRTKNGWHYVVEPFNLALWKGHGEVKKDGMLLLDF